MKITARMTTLTQTLKEGLYSFTQFISIEKKHLLTIAAVILVGNIFGIFGDQGLYLDDHFRHTFALLDLFPWYIGERNFIRPFFLWPMFNLMAISPYLARFVETLVFLIPVSWIFYGLLRSVFRLPILIAVIAAILPAIVPSQEAIPSFIDGCYTVQGLLSVLPCLWFGSMYISDKKPAHFLSAIAFYWLGLEMMDHSIFLAAPFGAYFLYSSYKKRNWRWLHLSVPIAILAIRKMRLILAHPVTANKIAVLSTFDVWERFRLSFFQSNPIGFTANWFVRTDDSALATILSLIVLFGGLIFFLPGMRYKLKTDEAEYPWYSLWGLIWMLATSLPFIFASPYYSSRYMHIAGYGANFTILINLYLVFSSLGKDRLFRFTAIGITVFSILFRQVYLARHFAPSNHHVQVFKSELVRFAFAENAQIAITGPIAIPTGEYWNYSSGALKMYLKRKDVEGNFGKEQFFYDPFQYPEGRAFTFHMNGFDLKKPLYLFRLVNDQFQQIEYALQWTAETTGWHLYQFSSTDGSLVRQLEGTGREALDKTIETQKIGKDSIMWYHP